MQKKILRIMMGAGPIHTCRGLFKKKKLGILPIPCVYFFSLMTFVVNIDKFQTNNSIHMINTSNDHFHIPIKHLSSYQRGVYYSGVKLFNTLATNISALKNGKNQFRIVL